MEWLKISTNTELVRVATDKFGYVRANGSYSDFVLTYRKVECRDHLYYIATRHKQTLWDFAVALREYVFHRDKYGIRHNIGDYTDYPHEKWNNIVPWLVFRKS